MADFDLLLRGGHVIDPVNRLDEVMDVGISGSRISAVASHLDAGAVQSIDMQGRYVVPGLIDMHVHVYPRSTVDGPAALVPDAHAFRVGVTTLVDAGTAGSNDFADFRANWIERSSVRLLAWINIAAAGMGNAEQDPRQFDIQKLVDTLAANSDVAVGVKTAHYWTRLAWDAEHPPWASVDAAVEAGERAHLPIMVDFWPRPPERPYADLILQHMRPGDIHTHVFAQQFPIVTEEGGVYDHLWRARERGVLFDLGHGAGSFWFRNAVPALAAGFPPDSISTDLHLRSLNGAALDTLHCVSKCIAMGMPIAEAIYRTTVTPARAIRRPELGTLSPGAEADVAVLRWVNQPRSFADCGRARLQGQGELACDMTLRAGRIVWDPTGLSMPEWTSAPAAYWNIPALQS
ncbi:MAG: amidohydrolase/deacetylase family metallohydrolase [Chloroflexi bacterium]|nr:amidohydrolase/deacetylase family metallohydrolase [Chloroflexota bacterium]MBV9599582.1 amidohydrolase/deacetylase family metallohydrolase [Chloroflexota bacterium]